MFSSRVSLEYVLLAKFDKEQVVKAVARCSKTTWLQYHVLVDESRVLK